MAWLFGGLGWRTLYLKNAYGFVRHGFRVTLCAWYENSLHGMIVLHAMIAYDRSIGKRETFVQERQVLYHFRTRGSDGSAGPARGSPARQGPSGRQLAVSSLKNEKGESAGHPRVSKTKTRVMMA